MNILTQQHKYFISQMRPNIKFPFWPRSLFQLFQKYRISLAEVCYVCRAEESILTGSGQQEPVGKRERHVIGNKTNATRPSHNHHINNSSEEVREERPTGGSGRRQTSLLASEFQPKKFHAWVSFLLSAWLTNFQVDVCTRIMTISGHLLPATFGESRLFGLFLWPV